MSTLPALLLAALLLGLNAFFVGAEFALVSARRSQIEPLAQAGSRMAKITIKAMENIALVIGVNQLGITICSLGLGAIAEPALAALIEPALHVAQLPDALLHPIAFAIALMIVVFLHVVLGEMVPKNISLAGPERVVVVLAPVVWGFVTVLRPVVVVLNAIARRLLALGGVELQSEVSSTYTREEVAALVEESRGEGLLEEEEYGRLTGALGFADKQVSAVVLPTASLTTISRGATASDLESLCAATGFSRFPVTNEDGSLMGYLHIKDVLETEQSRRVQVIDDKSIRPLAGVRTTDPLHDALETLQRRGAHMARVVDDSGQVVGLITLEDVIEELVGEIRDAAHQDEPTQTSSQTSSLD